MASALDLCEDHDGGDVVAVFPSIKEARSFLERTATWALALLDDLDGDPDAEDGADDEPDLGWTLNGARGTGDDREEENEHGTNEDGCEMGGTDNGIADHGGLEEQTRHQLDYETSMVDRKSARPLGPKSKSLPRAKARSFGGRTANA